MVFEIINIKNVCELTQQFPKLLLKCQFSTLKNVTFQNLMDKNEGKSKKLKLSQHTKKLIEPKDTNNILHFTYNDKVKEKPIYKNDIISKRDLSLYENVDITTITKPLKYPVVLCHGLFGFDKKGPESIPFLQVNYWNRIKKYLEQLGCKVLVPKVSPAGGVKYRAHELNKFIEANFPNQKVHLIAHSMGGLDCRYLITHVKPSSYKVLTLTTLSTPHRGSPFMDWCRKKFGVGWIRDPKHIPSAQPSFMAKSIKNATVIFNKKVQQKRHQHRQSFSKFFSKSVNKEVPPSNELSPSRSLDSTLSAITLLFNYSSSSIINDYNIRLLSDLYDMQTSSYYHMLCKVMSVFDMPAYRILTTDFCNNIFNPLTPDDPEVMYQSYGAARKIPFINPLSISQQIIKKTGQVENDGLVGVESAKWGNYKGTVQADHFDLNDRWSLNLFVDRFNVQDFYFSVIRELYPYEEI